MAQSTASLMHNGVNTTSVMQKSALFFVNSKNRPAFQSVDHAPTVLFIDDGFIDDGPAVLER
jgi:hypothetical protein